MPIEYITPPGDNSPAAIADEMFAYVEGAIPNWQAAPGNLETIVMEAASQPGADAADAASAMLTSAFRYFGQLVGVYPIEATSSAITVDFVLADNAGHTVPAGSTVGIRNASGQVEGFTLIDDVVVAATATTGSGAAISEETGEATNGLFGTCELVDVPAFVASASVADPSEGGADAEDDAVYLDRLAETLTLMSPRPILPGDFSILARQIAGVGRATAVDVLKPSSSQVDTVPTPVGSEDANAPLTVTVAVTDTDGLAVSSTIRNNVLAYLQSLRGQNFDVYVTSPRYQAMEAHATVVPWSSDTDPTILQADVEAAIAAFFSPALAQSGPTSNPKRWESDPVIRQAELYQVIMNVPGVRYVTALTFGLNGGSMATTNVTMGAGSAIPVLPTAGTIAVTVSP